MGINSRMLEDPDIGSKIMSNMIKQEFDFEPEPLKLRAFMCNHWTRLSLIAHSIHEAGDPYQAALDREYGPKIVRQTENGPEQT